MRQYDGQGMYCGQRTTSEVFLIPTTQLYSCLCNYNATLIFFIIILTRREYCNKNTSSPQYSPLPLPVGSKPK